MKPSECGLAFVTRGRNRELRYFVDYEKGQDKQGPFIQIMLADGALAKLRQAYSRKLERVLEPEEAIVRYPNAN